MQDFIMIKPENGCFFVYIIYNEKNRSGINKLYQLEKKKKFSKYFKHLQFIFIL